MATSMAISIHKAMQPFGCMAMYMVMGMHMVITRGGGHTTHGIIITLMEETLIQMYHLLVAEEVQEI